MTGSRSEGRADAPGEPLRSSLGWSTRDTIVVHGYDLCEDLIGKVDLGAMAFLSLTGRLPESGESVVFNACLVTLVEHGITPSALATRLTLHGAPESLQGAVAAGLLGLGDRFVGSIEGVARLTQEAWGAVEAGADPAALAREVVDGHGTQGRLVPGFGHPVHDPEDPRSTRLFALADAHGLRGRHVSLVEHVGEELARRGRRLPLNATGAIGALASELGVPWQVSRGIGVMARAVGLVGHVLEELRTPLSGELWRRVDAEVLEHREQGPA